MLVLPNSQEAVSLSVALLKEALAQMTFPVWINADILPGPGSQTKPLEPHAFLAAVKTLPTNIVLSLGWTTKWTAGIDNPGECALEGDTGGDLHSSPIPLPQEMCPVLALKKKKKKDPVLSV